MNVPNTPNPPFEQSAPERPASKNRLVSVLIKLGVCLLAAGVLTAGVALLCGAQHNLVVSLNGVQILSEQQLTDELAPFESIDLDVRYFDVTLQESDRFGIGIRYSAGEGQDCPVRYDVSGGLLTIKREGETAFRYSLLNFGFTKPDAITIFYPADTAFTEVDLDMHSGDLTAGPFETQTLRLRNDYGANTLTGITADAAELRSDSGSIRMEEFYADTLSVHNDYDGVRLANTGDRRFKEITIKTKSSEIRISGVAADTMTLSGSYENVRLENIEAGTLALDMSNMEIDAKNVTSGKAAVKNTYGELEAAGWVSGEFTGEFSSTDIDIEGSLGRHTSLSDSYGTIKLRADRSMDAYALDLKTTYEDIVINGETVGTKLKFGSAEDVLIIQASSCEVFLTFAE